MRAVERTIGQAKRAGACLGVAILAGVAAPALAGDVKIFIPFRPTIHTIGSGFTAAQLNEASIRARGNAYEFNGGVGVSGFAFGVGNGKDMQGDNSPQVHTLATISDRFVVGNANPLNNPGNGRYFLTIGFSAQGLRTTGQNPASNGVAMNPSAGYDWAFRLDTPGNVFSGSGSVYDALFNGSLTTTVTGLGANGTFSSLLEVAPGLEGSLLLRAGSFTSAEGRGDGSSAASADFSHTLRWLGVSRVQYLDPNNQLVDAPADFRLSLLSSTSGFDFWNAAGANPFLPPTGGVPEPASWAMMILGFGLVGSTLRRRLLRARTSVAA